MKKLINLIITAVMIFSLVACGKNNNATPDQTPTTSQGSIVGTWICDDINKDVFFIFDENGDAFAKYGTCTVYGYYDYDAEYDEYDIDIPQFFYNFYKASFSSDKMILTSEESSYTLQKAQLPDITINAPDNLVANEKLTGYWQSADSTECYQFNSDCTAVITDMYNYATVDCKYSCTDTTITLYSMASETNDNKAELEYKFTDDGNVIINGYTYEPIEVNS